MPENVTGFQPTGNLKKSLIDLAYFDTFPRRSPTFFREEPQKLTLRRCQAQLAGLPPWVTLSQRWYFALSAALLHLD
jgi:hypothetical protein